MTSAQPADAAGLHAVIGLGAVGRAVLDELARRELPARAVARHPPSDLAPSVQLVAADVTRRAEAKRALAGVRVAYHTAGAPYHRWPELLPPIMHGLMAGAAAVGARVVYADNLYAYGPVEGPLTEDLPNRARGPNGRVRAALADELMRAHANGTLQATIGRASDYYGPHGRMSHAGERLFLPALRGQPAQLLGNLDLPHTLTYLGDFARGLVTLGTQDAALGEVWHLPSAETITRREFVRLVFEVVGHPMRPRILPSGVLRLTALVNPTLRAVTEQLYQLEQPWVVDHSKFAHAFGAEVTPHRDAIAVSLAWFTALARP